MRYAFWKCRFYFSRHPAVQHVGFGDGEHPAFYQKFRIVLLEFVKQDFISLPYVVRIRRNHEQKYRIPFNMPQEPQSDSFPFVSSFYYTGNVRHYEGFVIPVAYYTEIRLECSESIVGYFRLCCSDSGQQGRFSCIRESYQTHVCQDFQFEDEPSFTSRFAWLGITRRLVGGGLEIVVPQSSPAAFDQYFLLSRLNQFTQDFTAFSVFGNRAQRNVEYDVSSVLAFAELSASGPSVLGPYMFAVFKVDQGPELRVCPENDMSSSTSVTSVRASFRNVFFPAQMHRTCAPVSGSAEYLHIVYEIAVSHLGYMVS